MLVSIFLVLPSTWLTPELLGPKAQMTFTVVLRRTRAQTPAARVITGSAAKLPASAPATRATSTAALAWIARRASRRTASRVAAQTPAARAAHLVVLQHSRAQQIARAARRANMPLIIRPPT